MISSHEIRCQDIQNNNSIDKYSFYRTFFTPRPFETDKYQELTESEKNKKLLTKYFIQQNEEQNYYLKLLINDITQNLNNFKEIKLSPDDLQILAKDIPRTNYWSFKTLFDEKDLLSLSDFIEKNNDKESADLKKYINEAIENKRNLELSNLMKLRVFLKNTQPDSALYTKLDAFIEYNYKIQKAVVEEIWKSNYYLQGQIDGRVQGFLLFSTIAGTGILQTQTLENLTLENQSEAQGIPYKNSKNELCTITISSLKSTDQFAIWVVKNPFNNEDKRTIHVITNIENDVFQKSFLPDINCHSKQVDDFESQLRKIIDHDETYEDLKNLINSKSDLHELSKMTKSLKQNFSNDAFLKKIKIMKIKVIASGLSSVLAMTAALICLSLGFGQVFRLMLSIFAMMLSALLAKLTLSINNTISNVIEDQNNKIKKP